MGKNNYFNEKNSVVGKLFYPDEVVKIKHVQQHEIPHSHLHHSHGETKVVNLLVFEMEDGKKFAVRAEEIVDHPQLESNTGG